MGNKLYYLILSTETQVTSFASGCMRWPTDATPTGAYGKIIIHNLSETLPFGFSPDSNGLLTFIFFN